MARDLSLTDAYLTTRAEEDRDALRPSQYMAVGSAYTSSFSRSYGEWIAIDTLAE